MKKIQVLLAVGLVFGVGFVAHAGPGDVIHGCIKRSQVLRIADTCSAAEKPISWSQEGPQGPQGEPGDSGFTVISDRTEPWDGNNPAGRLVTCPPGQVVIAASAWIEDAWGEMFDTLPVNIRPTIVDENIERPDRVGIDWHLWGNVGDVFAWNVTCGTV